MKDGLYQVTTSYLCAGFAVKNGIIMQIAPILRKKIDYWKTKAKFICP
jgi:MFS-type transporter involved in bile tolerance (Atg22 family)